MQNIKALLFDKDGTLTDLNQTWLQPMLDAATLIEAKYQRAGLADHLLDAGGWDVKAQSWRSDSIIAFDTSAALLRCWSEAIGKPIGPALQADIEQAVSRGTSQAVATIDNITDLTAQLAGRYRLGIASMDDEANIDISMRGLGIRQHFEFICGADSGHGLKPATGMLDAFVAYGDFNVEQVAVIGDSPKDLIMAKTAGAIGIGVLSGGCTAEHLQPYADLLLNDISELAPILLQQTL